jgi:hypothetical protein
MARLLINVTAPAATSVAAFEAAMNAALAPLLSHLIGGWDAQTTGALPAYIRECRGILDVETGGTVIATPYTVKVIEAESDTQAAALATAFIAANPLAFFAPGLYRYTDQLPNITKRSLYFLLTNSVLANGQANWAPGYPASTGGGAINTGKTVWVDSVFGNDATGARQRQDLPFLTINAAVTAALSGDVVYVRPGSYTLTAALSKAGITVFCPAGVTISYGASNVINAVGNNLSFNLLGQADFLATGAARFIDTTTSTGQTFFVQFRDHFVSGATFCAIRVSAAGNSMTIRCRNLRMVSGAGSCFSSDNGFASSATAVLDIWADENIANDDATALSLFQPRGTLPTYRFRCGLTMSSAGGSVIDPNGAGNSNTLIQADTFSAPNGILRTTGGGTYAFSGRVIFASSGNAVDTTGGAVVTLSGFATISGATNGILAPAGTLIIAGSSPNVSSSAGPGMTVSGATVTGTMGSITGTTAGLASTGGTTTLSCVAVTASAGPGISHSAGTMRLLASSLIQGTTFAITMTGSGSIAVTANNIVSTSGVALGVAGTTPTLRVNGNFISGSTGGIAYSASSASATIEVAARRLSTGNGGAISMTAGASGALVHVECQTIVTQNPGSAVQFLGGSATLRITGATIGNGQGACIQRDVATGRLVLVACALTSAGASNSIIAAVPTNVILNTPCGASDPIDANVTILGCALTISANIQ